MRKEPPDTGQSLPCTPTQHDQTLRPRQQPNPHSSSARARKDTAGHSSTATSLASAFSAQLSSPQPLSSASLSSSFFSANYVRGKGAARSCHLPSLPLPGLLFCPWRRPTGPLPKQRGKGRQGSATGARPPSARARSRRSRRRRRREGRGLGRGRQLWAGRGRLRREGRFGAGRARPWASSWTPAAPSALARGQAPGEATWKEGVLRQVT